MPALKDANGRVYMNICTKTEVKKSLDMLLGKSGSKQVFESTLLELKRLGIR